MRVRLTEFSRQDVRKAYDWYERERPGLGERFVAGVDQAIQRISDDPTLYAPIEQDARRVRLEKFPYALWYRITDGAVVVGCIHAARDLKLVKSRLAKPEPR